MNLIDLLPNNFQKSGLLLSSRDGKQSPKTRVVNARRTFAGEPPAVVLAPRDSSYELSSAILSLDSWDSAQLSSAFVFRDKSHNDDDDDAVDFALKLPSRCVGVA